MRLLISGEKIKRITSVGKNVEEGTLTEAVEIVQVTNLRSILGKETYEKILGFTHVDQASGKLVLNNAVPEWLPELIEDYIQPYMARKVVARLYSQITFKTRNAGVTTYNGQDFGVATMADADRMRIEMNNVAQTYAQLLQDKCKELGLSVGCKPNRSPIYFPEDEPRHHISDLD